MGRQTVGLLLLLAFSITSASISTDVPPTVWTNLNDLSKEINSTSESNQNRTTATGLKEQPVEDADEVDDDLGLETRSFHSSKRKNKISDSHFKLKEKRIKLADADRKETNRSVPSYFTKMREFPLKADFNNKVQKITFADLSDDLGDWVAPEEMQRNYPYYLAGYDNEERPLWVAEYGRFNIREMIEQGAESQALLEKYARQCAYRIYQSIRQRDHEVGDVVAASVILDLDGLSLYQITHPPTLVFVMRLVHIYAELVDECVGNVVVINVNYIAETLINLVRPLFGSVMEKVDIYGTQAAKWRPALRQLFPPESIPTWYGGSQGFKPIKVYG